MHATLSNIKGRRITVNALDQQRFVLEGTDSDGTFFHVLGAERNGAVRVLSIVFSERSSSALVRLIIEFFCPVSRNSTRTPKLTLRAVFETCSTLCWTRHLPLGETMRAQCALRA